jgi:hypothetical protein
MNPSQPRPTAADLKRTACELKARALQAQAAARRCGDPAQAKRLQWQADHDLREAGLAERAAISLEAETGSSEVYERLLAFQAGRENRPEPREPKREGIEKAPPDKSPVGTEGGASPVAGPVPPPARAARSPGPLERKDALNPPASPLRRTA